SLISASTVGTGSLLSSVEKPGRRDAELGGDLSERDQVGLDLAALPVAPRAGTHLATACSLSLAHAEPHSELQEAVGQTIVRDDSTADIASPFSRFDHQRHSAIRSNSHPD